MVRLAYAWLVPFDFCQCADYVIKHCIHDELHTKTDFNKIQIPGVASYSCRRDPLDVNQIRELKSCCLYTHHEGFTFRYIVPSTHWIGGWVGSRAGLVTREEINLLMLTSMWNWTTVPWMCSPKPNHYTILATPPLTDTELMKQFITLGLLCVCHCLRNLAWTSHHWISYLLPCYCFLPNF
jgi:hypothetical protein